MVEISIIFDDLLYKKVEECEIFSNPIRTTLALVILYLEDASWTEIKRTAEIIMGALNPNTLSFHITKLLNAGLIEKVGSDTHPRYRSTDKIKDEIQFKLGTELVKSMEERIKKNDGTT